MVPNPLACLEFVCDVAQEDRPAALAVVVNLSAADASAASWLISFFMSQSKEATPEQVAESLRAYAGTLNASDEERRTRERVLFWAALLLGAHDLKLVSF